MGVLRIIKIGDIAISIGKTYEKHFQVAPLKLVENRQCTQRSTKQCNISYTHNIQYARAIITRPRVPAVCRRERTSQRK